MELELRYHVLMTPPLDLTLRQLNPIPLNQDGWEICYVEAYSIFV
jgi:hypothetical protein